MMEPIKVGDRLYKIEPTSCRCGGNFAWLAERDSGAWEMVGCVCHHVPGSGDDVIVVRKEHVQVLVRHAMESVKPFVSALQQMGVISDGSR